MLRESDNLYFLMVTSKSWRMGTTTPPNCNSLLCHETQEDTAEPTQSTTVRLDDVEKLHNHRDQDAKKHEPKQQVIRRATFKMMRLTLRMPVFALGKTLRQKLSSLNPLKPLLLLSGTLTEEEKAFMTKLKHFYPMKMGEILNNRYQIAAKLGWGMGSTVWLARDLNR